METFIPVSDPDTDPDPSNPNHNPDPLFTSMDDFPPLDIDFLTNNTDLGSMDGLDFDISFDDLDFQTDQNPNNWFLNDNSDNFRVFENFDVSAPASFQDSGGCNSRSVVDGFLNTPSPVLSANFGDRSANDCFTESSPDFGNRISSDDVSRVNSPDSGNKSSNDDVFKGNCEDSGGCNSATMSPESGVVSGCSVESAKVEEVGKVCELKRKKHDEIENHSRVNPRSNKFRRPGMGVGNMAAVGSGAPEEDKKKARLMRNRESAQLSRQRKKHYVEELEDKVRSMHSVIADLNNKITYFMAENASLCQQLSSGGNVHVNHGVPPQPGVYPQPGMGTMPYPWIPCASYPMKPQGSQVPLLPIPRLKPRQLLSATKAKKSESKKSEVKSKTKKVLSVTFLGLLFFVLLFGGLVPLVNVRYGGKRETSSSSFGFGVGTDGGFQGQARGRVLTVSKHVNGSDRDVDVGYHTGKTNLRECGANRNNCRWVWVEGEESKGKQGKQGSRPVYSSNGFEHRLNSSEPLVASLYVPRNDKLVKIDGNLIIHSVLASEKAMASRAITEVKSDKATVSSSEESRQTSLAIPGTLAAAFPVSNGARHTESHPQLYKGSSVRPKALSSASRDGYKDSPMSTPNDGPLQKWFREGLAGPILNSGMCTEVFQFDISSSANPGGIIPATSSVNDTSNNASELAHRNRRIFNHLPAPLVGSEFNHSEEHNGIPSQNGQFQKNNSVPSMVVSVLADPMQVGDIDVDGGISPKSLSRIFVVVLIDSVKYVTYSCMLPFKGSSSHVVTT